VGKQRSGDSNKVKAEMKKLLERARLTIYNGENVLFSSGWIFKLDKETNTVITVYHLHDK
jgi:hypothetical protein